VTTTRKIGHYVPLALLAAAFSAACGAARPTPELVSARNAYTRARTGEAAQLNPKGVHEAYKALQAAEAVHADDAGSAAEKHYAYVATRRSELAIAQASQELARREQQRADQTYETSLERQKEQAAEQSTQYAQQLTHTQQELQQNSQALEQERQRLEQAQQAAQRARSELEQMEAMREEAGRMIISLSGVLFETGGAELSPFAQQRLDTVAQALAAYPDRQIVIEGHTDAQGNEETNRALSLQRADAVRNYLSQRGVPPEQLQVMGNGESEPVASNDTAEGRASNRRVEIVIDREGTAAVGAADRQNTSGAAGRERQNTAGSASAGEERERQNTSGRDDSATSPATPSKPAPRGGQQGTTPAKPAPQQPAPDQSPQQPSAPQQ
jgi:outer membrane protein OmpA-like peptidoglycan-associated protein